MSPQLPTHVPSLAHAIIITCVICPIVSAIIVCIRVWTRIVVTHNLSWDDYAAMVTLLFCISFSVVLGVSTKFGMGLHLQDMTPELLSDHWEWMYISSAMYLCSILGYRIALLLMYLRLFGVSQPFRYATWAVMFFVTGYLFSNIITLVFGCTPITKYWKPDEPGHCIVLVQADYAYGSMNVVSDVLLFLLPLPMVYQLRLTRREKVGLVLVFMSGIANCVVTSVRFALLVQNLHAIDTAWLDARTFLLTVVEINTGLICGSTPVLKPFFRHLLGGRPPHVQQIQSNGQSPMQSQQLRKQFDSFSRPGSIWIGGGGGGQYPDSPSRCNYRNFIELGEGKSGGEGAEVFELVD